MKKIYTLFLALIFAGSLMAQTPQNFKYQAVARDASGDVVADQAVGMQISILQGSTSGTSVYVETFTPTTNEFGLINLNIGAGTVVSGDFTTIDWSADTYFIKTEMDMTGGTTFEEYGTSQLLSVPYALHAKTAKSVTGAITETDPVYGASQAANITATDITNLGNLSGTNTGDQDLSALATKTALGDSTAKVHSEIPDVSGFLTSETDPVYTASEASNITATDITNLSNLSGTNTGDQDLSAYATKDMANANITNLANPVNVQDAATKAYVDLLESELNALKVRIEAMEPATIGDFRAGGVVFWVDPADNTHGLVCSVSDQDGGSGIQWFNGSYTTTGATATAIGTGQANTTAIVNNQGAGSYAAQVCNDFVENSYADWFLPSKDELNQMYQNKATIDATAIANEGSVFASDYYWSSTEYNFGYAWVQDFYNGYQDDDDKHNTYYVRAVRAF